MSKTAGLDKLANIAILVAVLVLLLNPSGIVGAWGKRWIAQREEERAVASVWNELIAVSSVLDMSNEDVATDNIVVEFWDYQCSFCRLVATTVAEASAQGEVRVVVRHLPLDAIHPAARDAAKFAVCAEKRGLFPAAHDILLGDEDWVDHRSWVDMAERIGIDDLTAFSDCMAGEEAEARIKEDERLAAELGIGSTPTFVAERSIHSGVTGFGQALAASLR